MTHFPSSLACQPPGTIRHLDIQSEILDGSVAPLHSRDFIYQIVSLMETDHLMVFCWTSDGFRKSLGMFPIELPSSDHVTTPEPISVVEASVLCWDSLIKRLLI